MLQSNAECWAEIAILFRRLPAAHLGSVVLIEEMPQNGGGLSNCGTTVECGTKPIVGE